MGHHNNKARHAMEETLSLEATVAAALSMVNIRETLVIVTADHSHAVTIRWAGRGISHDISVMWFFFLIPSQFEQLFLCHGVNIG
jgi:alkaline phosphatase